VLRKLYGCSKKFTLKVKAGLTYPNCLVYIYYMKFGGVTMVDKRWFNPFEPFSEVVKAIESLSDQVMLLYRKQSSTLLYNNVLQAQKYEEYVPRDDSTQPVFKMLGRLGMVMVYLNSQHEYRKSMMKDNVYPGRPLSRSAAGSALVMTIEDSVARVHTVGRPHTEDQFYSKEEMVRKDFELKAMEPMPVLPLRKGLRNIGNSCYINSTLQCLLACTHLNRYLLNQVWVRGEALSVSMGLAKIARNLTI
jgi:hypothetical protein